jgi:hypothetical protein
VTPHIPDPQLSWQLLAFVHVIWHWFDVHVKLQVWVPVHLQLPPVQSPVIEGPPLSTTPPELLPSLPLSAAPAPGGRPFPGAGITPLVPEGMVDGPMSGVLPLPIVQSYEQPTTAATKSTLASLPQRRLIPEA